MRLIEAPVSICLTCLSLSTPPLFCLPVLCFSLECDAAYSGQGVKGLSTFLPVELFSPPSLNRPSHFLFFYLVVGCFFHHLLQIRHLHWQLVDHACKATPV